MIEKKSVYKCEKCGNIIESLWDGQPTISCCENEMIKLIPNTTEAATEKHVPVIERDGNKVTVKVGEVEHPMTNEHYILFIEVITDQNVYRKDLKPGDSPVAEFLITEENITAREYCNLHGFWTSK